MRAVASATYTAVFLFFFQWERVQVCMLRVRVGAGNVSKVHSGAGANFVETGA